MLRGKFIALDACITKEERSKINNKLALGNQEKKSKLNSKQASKKKKRHNKYYRRNKIQNGKSIKKNQ